MQSSKVTIATGAVILVVLLVGAWYTWQAVKKQKALKAVDNPAGHVLQTSSDYAPYTDLAGNQMSLEDHLGKVLVVNSWASWSPFSEVDLRYLSEFAEQTFAEVQVIAINRAENPLTAERYLRRSDQTKNILLVLDPDDRYYRSIGGFAMPETIIYDEKGEVRLHVRGELTRAEVKEQFEAIISELIAK